MSARNMAKRTAAGTLALAVCLGGGALAFAGAANADAQFKFERFAAGTTRVETAVEASKKVFDKSDDVVIVNGWSTVDGLTAAYLAGVKNAPILYTEKDSAPQATRDELKRLGAKNVWLIGGTGVISKAQADAMAADYKVERIDGKDRYETAANIAEAGAKVAGKPGKVVIASGTSWADALAVSTVSYGKKYPTILVEKDNVPSASADELKDLAVDTKIVVGGEAVVSKGVYDKVSATERVKGADRAETANRVADWAQKSEGFKGSHVILVGSERGADSMVASALGGKNGWNIHYAGWAATSTFLSEHSAQLTGKGFVFGGTGAVSDADIKKAQDAAQAAPNLMAYSVSGPSGGKIVSALSDDLTTDADETIQGNVQYKVTGLGDSAIAVALVDPDAVKVDDKGNVSFLSSSTVGRADLTASAAGFISVINGVATGTTATTATNIKPVDGAVSLTVNSTAPGNLVPVFYKYSSTANWISVDSTKVGSDVYGASKTAFGIGKTLNYTAVAASTGSYAAATNTVTTGVASMISVTGVNAADKTFQGTYTVGTGSAASSRAATFSYGVAGSSYFQASNGTQLSADQFAAFIGKNDTVKVTYNSSGPSTFTFDADVPAGPTAVASVAFDNAGTGKADSIKVTFKAAPNLSATGYTVQRAEVSATGVVGSYSDLGSVATTAAKSYVDTTGTPGKTYVYRVFTTPGNATTAKSDVTTSLVFPKSSLTGAVDGAPTILDTRVIDGQFSATNSAAFKFGAGDEMQLIFNEPVSLPSGAALRLSDGVNSGTITIDGTNAEAIALAAGTYDGKTIVAGQGYRIRVLTVPTDASPSSSSMSLPVKVTAVTAGVVDLDEGKAVSLASGDVSVDGVNAFDVAYGAPVVTGGAWNDSARTATFTSSVPLAPSTVTSGDFSVTDTSNAAITGGKTVESVRVSADGKTVTVTLTSAGTFVSTNKVRFATAGATSFDAVAGTATVDVVKS